MSLTGALREANQDLRTQLQKEREEEKKKIIKPQKTVEEPQGVTNRWRKVLEASSPISPNGPGNQPPEFDEKAQARKGLYKYF